MRPEPQSAFEKTVKEEQRVGFLAETWGFVRDNKKWWLLPIGLVLFLFGVLILLAGTGAAPFIYTLF